jgi:hypothetical protein
MAFLVHHNSLSPLDIIIPTVRLDSYVSVPQRQFKRKVRKANLIGRQAFVKTIKSCAKKGSNDSAYTSLLFPFLFA